MSYPHPTLKNAASFLKYFVPVASPGPMVLLLDVFLFPKEVSRIIVLDINCNFLIVVWVQKEC